MTKSGVSVLLKKLLTPVSSSSEVVHALHIPPGRDPVRSGQLHVNGVARVMDM